MFVFGLKSVRIVVYDCSPFDHRVIFYRIGNPRETILAKTNEKSVLFVRLFIFVKNTFSFGTIFILFSLAISSDCILFNVILGEVTKFNRSTGVLGLSDHNFVFQWCQ